jgi:hypothetical protein
MIDGSGGVERCRVDSSMHGAGADCDDDDDDDGGGKHAADAGAEAARENKPHSLSSALLPTASSHPVPNAVACGAEVARSSEGRAECAVTAA